MTFKQFYLLGLFGITFSIALFLFFLWISHSNKSKKSSYTQLFFELRDNFGQTFVIVTHNEELANMADRKLTMVDGKISS
jgi:hypothetical protein